ncbi:MAG: hypothetical protein H6658_15660 [Ardenticatenaceae bacterium]|nr:hypothetical protein [Ardenticatenaceae bacterium]
MSEPLLTLFWTTIVTTLLCLGGFVPGALMVWLVMRRRRGLKPAAILGSAIALFVLAVSDTLMIQAHIGTLGLGYIFATLLAGSLQLAGIFTLSLLLREHYKRSGV